MNTHTHTQRVSKSKDKMRSTQKNWNLGGKENPNTNPLHSERNTSYLSSLSLCRKVAEKKEETPDHAVNAR